MSVAPDIGIRSLCIVAALFAGAACKRTQHLAEGPPLRAEYIDAGRPMMVGDPAAMARAMAAADASARLPPGVPGAQRVPGAPVVDAGAPSLAPITAPIVVVDAGTAATPEPAAQPSGRRRRRRR